MFLRTGAFFSSILSEFLKNLVALQQISNRFDGVVEFDKDGLPISRQEGHGFGTRSIAAFCEKYGAFYEFKATRDTFYLRITFE